MFRATYQSELQARSIYVLRDFGEAGAGVFPAPTVLEKQLQKENGLTVLGRVPSIRGRFYAISLERKLRHPAIIAISESARRKLFAE
jgi:LysR family transcriptional activator of nhaA